jgi:hypothetical protein
MQQRKHGFVNEFPEREFLFFSRKIRDCAVCTLLLRMSRFRGIDQSAEEARGRQSRFVCVRERERERRT